MHARTLTAWLVLRQVVEEQDHVQVKERIKVTAAKQLNSLWYHPCQQLRRLHVCALGGKRVHAST